jgi:hypothetical protein
VKDLFLWIQVIAALKAQQGLDNQEWFHGCGLKLICIFPVKILTGSLSSENPNLKPVNGGFCFKRGCQGALFLKNS